MELVNPAYLKQELNSSSMLYCKIDWLTVMFKDCTMRDVLKWISMESAIPDFMENILLQTRGLDQKYIFTYNQVKLEAPTLIFYGVPENVCIFDLVVPSIRLELSGGALDYLRSCGIDPNALRYKVPVSSSEGMSWHFSRCDFAYDFINYSAGFVDVLIDFIENNRLPSSRVPLAGTSSAVSATVRTGAEKTVYLGSPQSDKLLRVYDKRMQYIDLATGVYKKENSYNNPASWFRIEWQTRNKFADGIVRNVEADSLHILRLIFDHYAFARADFDARNCKRPPVDFWLNLLKWEDIKAIEVLNGDFVYFKTPEERLESAVVRGGIMDLIYISKYGLKEYLEKKCSLFNNIDRSDPSGQRKYEAYLARINEYDCIVHQVEEGGEFVPGFNQINGNLVFCLGEVPSYGA